MKRNVFLAALFMVLVALNGSHGQPRINHSTPDRFAEKKEALVKIVRAWQEARGSESRLKEYHQLYMERIRGVQSDSEDFMKVCKELILLERSIRRRDSMKEVKDKIIKQGRDEFAIIVHKIPLIGGIGRPITIPVVMLEAFAVVASEPEPNIVIHILTVVQPPAFHDMMAKGAAYRIVLAGMPNGGQEFSQHVAVLRVL